MAQHTAHSTQHTAHSTQHTAHSTQQELTASLFNFRLDPRLLQPMVWHRLAQIRQELAAQQVLDETAVTSNGSTALSALMGNENTLPPMNMMKTGPST
jgi:hypothetical protein